MIFDVLVVLGFNGMMSSTSSVTVGVDVTGGVVVITDVVEVVAVVVVATVVVSTSVMEDVVTVVEVVVTVTVLVVEVDVVEVITFFADRSLKFKMLFSDILVQKVRFIFHETNLMGSNGLNSTFGNVNFGKLNPLADITNRNKMLTILKSQY